jgi:hypothetical protein
MKQQGLVLKYMAILISSYLILVVKSNFRIGSEIWKITGKLASPLSWDK